MNVFLHCLLCPQAESIYLVDFQYPSDYFAMRSAINFGCMALVGDWLCWLAAPNRKGTLARLAWLCWDCLAEQELSWSGWTGVAGFAWAGCWLDWQSKRGCWAGQGWLGCAGLSDLPTEFAWLAWGVGWLHMGWAGPSCCWFCEQAEAGRRNEATKPRRVEGTEDEGTKQRRNEETKGRRNKGWNERPIERANEQTNKRTWDTMETPEIVHNFVASVAFEDHMGRHYKQGSVVETS